MAVLSRTLVSVIRLGSQYKFMACVQHNSMPVTTLKKRAVCSIATHDGRKSISSGRFISTSEGKRMDNLINNDVEYRQILEQTFQIFFPPEIRIEALIASQQ
jgi:N-hydroxyarylamine O-acetyltransferase